MVLKIAEATPGERKEAYVSGIQSCMGKGPRTNPYPLYYRRRNDWYDGYDRANRELTKLLHKMLDTLPDFRPRMY